MTGQTKNYWTSILDMFLTELGGGWHGNILIKQRRSQQKRFENHWSRWIVKVGGIRVKSCEINCTFQISFFFFFGRHYGKNRKPKPSLLLQFPTVCNFILIYYIKSQQNWLNMWLEHDKVEWGLRDMNTFKGTVYCTWCKICSFLLSENV